MNFDLPNFSNFHRNITESLVLKYFFNCLKRDMKLENQHTKKK